MPILCPVEVGIHRCYDRDLATQYPYFSLDLAPQSRQIPMVLFIVGRAPTRCFSHQHFLFRLSLQQKPPRYRVPNSPPTSFYWIGLTSPTVCTSHHVLCRLPSVQVCTAERPGITRLYRQAKRAIAEELLVIANLLLRVPLRTGGGNSSSYIPLSFCANLLVRQRYFIYPLLSHRMPIYLIGVVAGRWSRTIVKVQTDNVFPYTMPPYQKKEKIQRRFLF